MKSLYIEHNINVCTYDIDFAGHVSNIAYLRWLEDMRLHVFAQYCPLEQFLQMGMTPVLASTEIHYKKPIRLFDRPLGKMWVSDLGLSSMKIDAEIYVDGVLTTSARHVGVFVEMSKMKPVRVPQLFLEAVKNYQDGLMKRH